MVVTPGAYWGGGGGGRQYKELQTWLWHREEILLVREVFKELSAEMLC